MLGRPSPDTGFHGDDGMGDCPDEEEVDMGLIQEEHAVNALIRLVNQHKGTLSAPYYVHSFFYFNKNVLPCSFISYFDKQIEKKNQKSFHIFHLYVRL